VERIGDDLRATLRGLGPAGTMEDVVRAWPDAVGEGIARNAWPARLARDGTLHVATASSAWSFELTQLEPTIRKRLAAKLGQAAPGRLRFAPGPLPELGVVEEQIAPARRRAPSAKVRARARELTAAMDDEELRELVSRAAAASLDARGADRAL
jgi:hypothetical protein